MTDKPQKPATKLTTEQAMERLFPKPVIEQVKREIGPVDTGGPGVQKPRSKSITEE